MWKWGRVAERAVRTCKNPCQIILEVINRKRSKGGPNAVGVLQGWAWASREPCAAGLGPARLGSAPLGSAPCHALCRNRAATALLRTIDLDSTQRTHSESEVGKQTRQANTSCARSKRTSHSAALRRRAAPRKLAPDQNVNTRVDVAGPADCQDGNRRLFSPHFPRVSPVASSALPRVWGIFRTVKCLFLPYLS